MQRKEMEALTAHLKEEDSKIEKVSAQIHSTKTNDPNCFQRSLRTCNQAKVASEAFCRPVVQKRDGP